MNEVIQENSGSISDVSGDGILAVLARDIKCDNSVLDTIRAIEVMKAKLKIFNKYPNENFNIEFGIRAGVHC